LPEKLSPACRHKIVTIIDSLRHVDPVFLPFFRHLSVDHVIPPASSRFERVLGRFFALSTIGRGCVYALYGLVPLQTLKGLVDRPDSTLTLPGGWDIDGCSATSATLLDVRFSEFQAVLLPTGPASVVTIIAFNAVCIASSIAYFSGSQRATFSGRRALSKGAASTVVYDLSSRVGLLPAADSLCDQTVKARAIIGRKLDLSGWGRDGFSKKNASSRRGIFKVFHELRT